MKSCPSCNSELFLEDIKDSFECDSCHSLLESNSTLARILPLLIGGIVGFFLSSLLFESRVFKLCFEAAFAILCFVVFWPMLLKVDLAEKGK